MEITHHEDMCYCNKIPKIAHDLTQSLLIIQAYIKGCTVRLKENNLDLMALFYAFEKINEHIKIMSNKINCELI